MIKVILKSIYLFFFFFSCGALYNSVFRRKDDGNTYIGVLFSVSVAQVIIIPLYLLGVRVDRSYALFGILMVMVTAYGLYYLLRYRGEMISRIKKVFTIRNAWYVLAFAILIIELFFYLFYYRHNNDDVFYVANINTSLDTNKWFFIDPSTGNEAFSFSQWSAYIMSGWETELVFLSRFFRVDGAVFAHSILPQTLLPIHYAAIYELSKRISDKYRAQMLALYSVMNLFSMYSDYQIGNFLNYRIWQGKAVMCNILFPVILLSFVRIYKYGMSMRDISTLSLCMVSGVALNPTGMYLVPILYGGYCLSYTIMKILRHEKEGIVREVKYFLVPLIVVLPITVMRLYCMQMGGIMTLITEKADTMRYWDIVRNIVGTGYIIVILWGLSIIICLMCSTEEIRFLVSIYSIIILATFLNPVLCPFVARTVSSTETYWRLFWLLQPQCTILFGAHQVLSLAGKRRVLLSNITMIMICLTVAIGGKCGFINGRFVKKVNLEAITELTKSSVDEVMKDDYFIRMEFCGEHPRILMPKQNCHEIRQYTACLEVVWTKCLKHLSNTNDDIENFMNELYSDNDCTNLVKNIDAFDIDYIALRNDADINDFGDELTLIHEDEEYSLYRTGHCDVQ